MCLRMCMHVCGGGGRVCVLGGWRGERDRRGGGGGMDVGVKG